MKDSCWTINDSNTDSEPQVDHFEKLVGFRSIQFAFRDERQRITSRGVETNRRPDERVLVINFE